MTKHVGKWAKEDWLWPDMDDQIGGDRDDGWN